MVAYLCGARNELVEGHHPDECPFCLRRMRDFWKEAARADHVQQIQNLGYRVRKQREELARLNKQHDLYQNMALRLFGEVQELKKAAASALPSSVANEGEKP